jgi:hypothetical protein
LIRQDDDGGDFGGGVNDGKSMRWKARIGDMEIGHLNGYRSLPRHTPLPRVCLPGRGERLPIARVSWGFHFDRPPMAAAICSAWAKSRNRPCRRRVVMRPDGRPHTVCASHGGLTPNPRTAVLSDIGRQRISAAAKAHWEGYRANKLAGLSIPHQTQPLMSTAARAAIVAYSRAATRSEGDHGVPRLCPMLSPPLCLHAHARATRART